MRHPRSLGHRSVISNDRGSGGGVSGLVDIECDMAVSETPSPEFAECNTL
jgi:hypothetical protein